MNRTDLSTTLWISALAAGGLLACADPTPAPPSAASRVVAVPTIAGVPARVLRGGLVSAAPAPTPADSALALVARLAPAWGAPRGAATLDAFATTAVGGGELVRIRQLVDGVPVEGGELRVLVGPGGTLLAASGAVVPVEIARDRTGFILDADAAVARAVDAVHGVDVSAGLRAKPDRGGARWFAGRAADVTVQDARAQRVWHRDGNALVPAWLVEAYTSNDDSTDSLAYRTVVAARDGRVLEQRSLTADAFTYRVWAETSGDQRPLDGPTTDFSPNPSGVPGGGRPAFIAPNLVTVDGLNHPTTASPDPWLPAGSTETVGNNVDAYSDVNSPSGLSSGDFRASVTGPGVFDRTYDVEANPLASMAQQQAAITQLFYSLNWLHDDWYDAGFTEATGNGQQNNYGRGGVDGDPVLAEAQDGANDGNRNNANMSTPSDGMTPRMQVYLWTGTEDETITSQPAGRTSTANGAGFGPAQFDRTGVLVLGTDGSGPSSTDGCEALTNAAAVAGKIVILDRGNCPGERKAANAQAAGAIGAIIPHNVAGSPAQSLPNDSSVDANVTIPTMSVGYDAGMSLRGDVASGPTTVTMHRALSQEAEGALDASLVAHEFGHYVHHRLSRCDTKMCGAMSEGWADFVALLTLARPGDDLSGAYSISTYAYGGDPYFGLRRAPYSTDLAKNPFTYRLVADGQALPNTAPRTPSGSPNSEVHNAGEIWAQMLWEAYVGLQQARGTATFDETRRTMQRYVVAGLLLAPPDATFTETRDALLAAALAASPADHDTIAAGFARRGLGSCAASPDSESQDFVGATESFELDGHARAGVVTVAIDVKDCDGDATLDIGETATITVPVQNDGAQALDAVTVSLTTTTPGLTILTQPIAVGAMASYSATTATFQVRLDAATGPAAAVLDLTITAPDSCVDTLQIPLPVRLAADDKLAQSATDSFDAEASVWTFDGQDSAVVWAHRAASLDGVWHGADIGTESDTVLTSPALQAGSGTVTIELDHTYDFEASDQLYDGGLIEISLDDGASWTDVNAMTPVPYTGMLATDSFNPLGGALVFGGTNPSYPARDHLTLDFGSQLRGKTFRIRFRIATDAAVGAGGWTIDNVAISGLGNKPFPTLVVDDGTCDGTQPMGEPDDGGCCSTGSDPATPLALGFAIAGLLVRRRRRA